MISIGATTSCHPRHFWLSDLELRNLPDLHCGFGVTQDMPTGQGAAFIPVHSNFHCIRHFLLVKYLECWKLDSSQFNSGSLTGKMVVHFALQDWCVLISSYCHYHMRPSWLLFMAHLVNISGFQGNVTNLQYHLHSETLFIPNLTVTSISISILALVSYEQNRILGGKSSRKSSI